METNPKALSASEILGAEDCPTEAVEVPEWGGVVYIRTLRGCERDEYEARTQLLKDRRIDPRGTRAALLVKALADENGKPIFTLEQLAELNRKSAPVLARLFDRAAKLNRMEPGYEEIEVGNSNGGQSGDSGSDWPPDSGSPSDVSSES